MEINVLKYDKNEIDVEIDNITLIEILRVYLNKDSAVTFAAWKREHFTVKPVLKVKTKDKDSKVAINDAVKAVVSDLEGFGTDFKTAK